MKTFENGLKMAVALFAAGAVWCSVLAAEDRTIVEGESVTISENTTYGTLIVNGELTVHTNKLTVERLVVATNITGTAKLKTELGAKIVCSTGHVVLGAAGGRAEVDIQSGSSLVISKGSLYHSIGYDEQPESSAKMSSCFIRVAGTVTISTGPCIQGSKYHPEGATGSLLTSVIQLDDGGVFNVVQVIKAKTFQPGSQNVETWLFNGGTLATSANDDSGFFAQAWADNRGSVNLTATNDHEIAININHSFGALFRSGSSGHSWNLSGDLVLGGSQVLPWAETNQYWNVNTPNVRFNKTGSRIVLKSGGLTCKAPRLFRETTSGFPVHLEIRAGASFDLKGNDQEFLTVKDYGVMTNSAAGLQTLTLTSPDADSVLYRLPPRLAVVKQGTGTLDLCAESASAVDVQGGKVVFHSSASMGYPLVKWQLAGIRAGFDSNSRLYMAELAFLTGTEDVTRPYLSLTNDLTGTRYVNSPTRLFDQDLATSYYDLRASSESKVSRVAVTLGYDLPKKITGYTFATSSQARTSDPKAWKVLAGPTTNELVEVDNVESYDTPAARTAWVGTNFVIRADSSVPATSVATLTLADGVELAASGAALDLSDKTFANLPLTIADGAKVTLSEGTTVSSLAFDHKDAEMTLVNFTPAAGGQLKLTVPDGESVPHSLPVALSGTRSFDALSSWTVMVNGEPWTRGRLCIIKDHLALRTGAMLILR